MTRWMPDPSFYPTALDAMRAPPEALAYVALLGTDGVTPDALGVVDTDPTSPDFGELVEQVEFPDVGNELHHLGWNACSSHLCPWASNAHAERRYLIVPGTGSSRIHVLDTRPDPRRPELVRVIQPEELARKVGYTAPHTVHCGPDGIYLNALGSTGGDGPGGIFTLDHRTFNPVERWERDRGPQHLAYDFAWHLGQDTLVTSEWGTPNMVKDGLDPELLLGVKYGHALHVWDLRKRRHLQTLDLGAQHQMVLELRPARDPRRAYGFAGVVISLEDLSSSVWLWYLDQDGNAGRGEWKARKVITIPAEPADESQLPPALQPFGAVPPLVSDIDLSVDDRWLYVSCWGTGELKQYDVSDPHNPREAGSVHLGGIVRRTPHPADAELALAGGPQMVEVSRDGRRVYFTNSLYAKWDDIFYPDDVGAWMARLDANTETGGMTVDPRFFPNGDDFRGLRVHQTRLQGGDASSDSYCFVE
jgi:methanethiol oxidase